MATIEIRIYRAGNEWCFAADSDGQYDTSDTIGVDDDASEEEAGSEIRRQYADRGHTIVSVKRIADIA